MADVVREKMKTFFTLLSTHVSLTILGSQQSRIKKKKIDKSAFNFFRTILVHYGVDNFQKERSYWILV